MTSPASKNSDQTPLRIPSRAELRLFIIQGTQMSFANANQLFESCRAAAETSGDSPAEVVCDARIIPLDSASIPGSVHRALERHFSWLLGRPITFRNKVHVTPC